MDPDTVRKYVRDARVSPSFKRTVADVPVILPAKPQPAWGAKATEEKKVKWTNEMRKSAQDPANQVYATPENLQEEVSLLTFLVPRLRPHS